MPFTEYVLALDPQQAYDLVSANRGPDYRDPDTHYTPSWLRDLKRIGTARIRGILFGNIECAGNIETTPLTRMEVDALDARIRTLDGTDPSWRASAHYRQHLADAITVTMQHPIWGGLGHDLYQLIYTWS